MANIQLHRSFNLTAPTSFTNPKMGPGERWTDFDGGYRMAMTPHGDDTLRDLYLTHKGDRVFSMSDFMVSSHPSNPIIKQLLDNGNILPLLSGILAGDDHVIGSEGRDVIGGLTGNDTIHGFGGHDVLRGGAGKDLLDGGTGNDLLDGGAANDTLLGQAGADTLRGAAGNDNLLGGAGNDLLDGGRGNDSMLGQAGADILRGGVGNDSLDGGRGNDLLDGGAGNDRLIAGSGADIVRGGSGVDTLEFQTSARVTVDLTLAKLQAFQGGSVTVSGVENLRGGYGHDRLLGDAVANVLEGGAGRDTLLGRAGNDRLLGGAANDLLDGGRGNDSLHGQAGADTLRGGAGSDRLDGGDGNDLLIGGPGADRFVFRSGSGQDRINDFTQVQDRIVFEAGPKEFSDLQIIDRGGNTVIKYGADSINLVNVDHLLIDEADFVFA